MGKDGYGRAGRYTGSHRKPVFIFVLIWIFSFATIPTISPNQVWNVRGRKVFQQGLDLLPRTKNRVCAQEGLEPKVKHGSNNYL